MEKFDFVFELKKDTVNILFLTDTQIIDSMQRRYPERLTQAEIDKWLPEKKEERLYRYVRDAVKAAQPDMILIGGDFVYGEFDDNGTSFIEEVRFMDSFEIPWSFVYGNHERDCAKDGDFRNTVLAQSKYCFFKSENFINGHRLEGEGNFSIGLYGNGRLCARMYMLDTGCGSAEYPCGIHKYQRQWLEQSARLLNSEEQSAPAFMLMHIPFAAFSEAALKYGTVTERGQMLEANRDGDFGALACNAGIPFDADGTFFELVKKLGTKAVFVGHVHQNSACIKHCNVQLCYILKTGEYDSHLDCSLGGTQLTLFGTQYQISHLYISK